VINLHGSVQRNATVAAAWTTYAGAKAPLRMGEYVKLHPEAVGRDSPFDEECYLQTPCPAPAAVSGSSLNALKNSVVSR
jgi:hypothetical protein